MIVKPEDLKELTNSNGFIVLEGVNGAGKSTLVKKIAACLSEDKQDFFLTREPGSGEIGQVIRKILLDSKTTLPQLSELFLFAADRSNHVEKIIKPELKKGNIVISDRYYYSTIAFQGYGRKINLDTVNTINEIATAGLKPDFVILLDLDPKTGLIRNHADKPEERDSFEEEDLAFHQRIRDGFLELARSLPEKFIIIDASQSADKVWEETKLALNAYRKATMP